MKKIWLVLCCLIIITSLFVLSKQVYASADPFERIWLDMEERLVREEQEQQEWRQKYYGKIIFLENIMYIVVAIVIFNIILFSILSRKGKSIELIYKILQIIFLILIYLLYRIWDDIPGEPGAIRTLDLQPWADLYRPIMVKIAFIESIILLITLFINKKIYLFIGFILIGLLSLNIVGIMGMIGLIIITNILFLPLYLSKKQLKEEENVRIRCS